MHSLVNRRGNYYFRLRVPRDLLPYFDRSELLKSLHTEKYHLAKSLVRCLLGKAERVFTMLRSKMLDSGAVHRLVAEFVESTLELKYDDTQVAVEACEDIMQEIYEDAEVVIDAAVKTRLPQITHLPFTAVSAEQLCWINGVEYLAGSPSSRQLEHELAISKQDIIQTIKERLSSGTSAYDRRLLKQRYLETESKDKSNTLSEAISAYCAAKASTGRGKDKLQEIMAKISECFEYESKKQDILLSEIDYDLTKRVGHRLAKYPKYRGTKFKGKSLDEVYELGTAEYPAMEGTIKPELYRMTGLYGVALNRLDGLKKNYADGLADTIGGKSKAKASKAKDVFSANDIQEIIRVLGVFKLKGEFKKNPHLLFITLMGFLTGARINEICQLTVDDIYMLDELWCIRHEETGEDKSLKTDSSSRINPIHPDLIEFGLIRFRDSQRAKGYTGLWEGGKNHSCAFYETSGNCSHYVSKWWNGTFKDKLVLSSPDKQTFHSTRHTFINWFKQNVSGLDYAARNALSGHLDKDDIAALELQGYDRDAESEKTYTKDLNVSKQMDTLRLLDYGVDLSPLQII